MLTGTSTTPRRTKFKFSSPIITSESDKGDGADGTSEDGDEENSGLMKDATIKRKEPSSSNTTNINDRMSRQSDVVTSFVQNVTKEELSTTLRWERGALKVQEGITADQSCGSSMTCSKYPVFI